MKSSISNKTKAELLENPGVSDELWSVLRGGLWHATSPTAALEILNDGCIKPAHGNRYTNSYCRLLDSISLFDFGPTATDNSHQFRNWNGWFGSELNTEFAVWLEIDRSKTIQSTTDAETARIEWNLRPSNRFIPGVESCHKGPIYIEKLVGYTIIPREFRRYFYNFSKFNRKNINAIERLL